MYLNNNDSKEVVEASARIDAEGNIRSVDNPYEEGIYCAVIGLDMQDNPYEDNDPLNKKLWLKGYAYVLARRRGEVK